MAIDWTKSMQQTYEYYIVNPNTWRDETPYRYVTSSTINRDFETDTLGSASFDITQPIDECYVRTYLVASQNGIREKHPLGIHLVQTPAINFNGKRSSITADGYTPLIELKEKMPPIGFFIQRYRDGIESALTLTKENVRAPVVGSVLKTWYPETDYEPHNGYLPAKKWIEAGVENRHIGDIFYDTRTNPHTIYIWSSEVIESTITYSWKQIDASDLRVSEIGKTRITSDFVADIEDTWFTFLSDLLSHINRRFDLDEMGRIGFTQTRKLDAMQPIWTYNDDNSSILDPNVDIDCDLFGIPNVVEVIYSTNLYSARCVAENHDPNSPLSIENRGRKIVHRVTDPGFAGVASKEVAKTQVQDYAKQLLKEMSTIERTVTYTHGYCPVRLDDCVRLNYTKAGLNDVKARVISQNIKCVPGCPVTEKAVYSTKLLNEDYITID